MNTYYYFLDNDSRYGGVSFWTTEAGIEHDIIVLAEVLGEDLDEADLRSCYTRYDLDDPGDVAEWLNSQSRDTITETEFVAMSEEELRTEIQSRETGNTNGAVLSLVIPAMIATWRAARQTARELESIMTTSEIAEEFGLDESTPKKAAQAGIIPARKSGGTWLIRRSDAIARWGRSAGLTVLALALTAVVWIGLFA